jgi:hypothetical protein
MGGCNDYLMGIGVCKGRGEPLPLGTQARGAVAAAPALCMAVTAAGERRRHSCYCRRLLDGTATITTDFSTRADNYKLSRLLAQPSASASPQTALLNGVIAINNISMADKGR